MRRDGSISCPCGMTFSSLTFAAFLALLLSVHLLARRRLWTRNALLLVASYTFYAAWDARFLTLIVGSTIVDYVAARCIAGKRGPRRVWLLLSIVANLGLLAAFKYFGFFVENFAALAAGLGWHPDLPTLGLALPVGISFHTFQTLGYTIDVYRGRVEAERNVLTFALFVAYFPQLVAGPIERAGRLLPQLRIARPLCWSQLQRGFLLVATGLFKKVVIADNVAFVVNGVFDASAPAQIDVLIAAYAFAIQIYCDFSAYTDIARGVSKWFGIELVHNFDRPYLASTPRAFWRRWHISLSTWFRDYVYVPLGGRTGAHGAVRSTLIVLIVFVLAGLWHGAAWTFLCWGLFHGTWLVAWRAVCGAGDRARWPHALSVLATFHGVCLGWLLFRADSIEQCFQLLTASGASVLGPIEWRIFASCTIVCVVAAALRAKLRRRDWVFALPFPARVAVYLVLWFGVVLFGVTDELPFLYFQF